MLPVRWYDGHGGPVARAEIPRRPRPGPAAPARREGRSQGHGRERALTLAKQVVEMAFGGRRENHQPGQDGQTKGAERRQDRGSGSFMSLPPHPNQTVQAGDG